MKWSASDVETALQMRRDGITLQEIARYLGRSYDVTRRKLWGVAQNENPVEIVHDLEPRVYVPDAVQIDRDHRVTLMPRDTTALFCGDPLPGYSMLERRT